jgi:NAD(P)-dependent dehydrogenase (short-subunit alcohol dehydrogenase family)
MARQLAGMTAIVVGASSGMGAAVARALARESMHVAVAARSTDRLEAVAAELRDAGASALALPTDVSDRAAVERMVSATRDRFGRIDLLVYAAGMNVPDRSLERLRPETWEKMLATNLTGAFHCTQLVLPAMREQGEGLIIYLSSAAVGLPDVSGVSYQSSKHGLSGLAFGTSVEEKARGVRTCVIFPGLTDTPILQQRPTPTPADVLRAALKPEDVAEAVAFVARLDPRASVPQLWLLPSRL